MVHVKRGKATYPRGDHLTAAFLKYFFKTGIIKKWFANKVGMQTHVFYMVMNGTALLPRKYWNKVIAQSAGNISIQDILLNRLKDVPGLEIIRSDDPYSCTVKLMELPSEPAEVHIPKNTSVVPNEIKE